jgi:tripartite-type tricarboxylate transporter receptor subunit TctC
VTFNGLFAPKRTPKDVVDRLSAVYSRGVGEEGRHRPACHARLAGARRYAEEFTRFLQEETAKWAIW